MNGQLTLQFQPLSRRADPQTSHDAAEHSAEFRAKHEGAIWAALKDYGPGICETIAMGTGLDEIAVARRMKGLERRGLVRRAGIGVNRKGNKCTRWEAA